jgi:hypothetical protein|tara:strand:+ start:278 stop:514 length:237 start_codon:yes stop_codon:yes gene_type:complete
MKAIQIRYLPPTNTLGSRYKAFTKAGSLTIGYDYGVDDETQAKRLAYAYCSKYDWRMPLDNVGFGTLPNGDYVFTIGF